MLKLFIPIIAGTELGFRLVWRSANASQYAGLVMSVGNFVLVHIKCVKRNMMSLIKVVAIIITSHAEFAGRHKAHRDTFIIGQLIRVGR
jgi:hypothetical protein